MLTKLGKDVVEVGLQGFGVAGLEGHPLVLDFAPEDLDAVELRTVGWQKVQGQLAALGWALSASISALARPKAASHRFFERVAGALPHETLTA